MITIDPPSSAKQADFAIPTGALTRFLRRVCSLLDLSPAVAVLLTSDAELKRLNRRFRGKNRSTDVLSFPAEAPPGVPAQHAPVGDLAISLETAQRQAEHFGHTLGVEVRILALHGLLHLAGLDHELDNGEMAAREAALRRQLHLPTGLIDRVTGSKVVTTAGRETRRKPVVVRPVPAASRRRRSPA